MKILFFVEAEQGLGHIVRSKNIVSQIKKMCSGADVVCVTNSTFFGMFNYCRVVYLSLHGHISECGQLNEVFDSAFVPILDSEKPDIVVFDTFYSVRVCKDYQMKKVLILRKYFNEDLKKIFSARHDLLFDLVLVPHEKEEFAKVNLPKNNRIIFTGPIVNTAIPTNFSAEFAPDEFVVLVTCGGGGFPDAEMFLNTCVSALKGLPVKQVFVTGPYYQAKLDADNIVDYRKDFASLMKRADLVISQAGYNIVNELAYHKKNAIIIPSRKPNDDQVERAEYFRNIHGFYVLHDFDPARLRELVARNIEHPKKEVGKTVLAGNRMAASLMLGLIQPVNPLVLKVGKTCNNSCVYCELLAVKADSDKAAEQLKKEIDACSAVVFPCNSDLRSDFVELVSYAAAKAIPVIVRTNGRMFSYRDLAKSVSGKARFEVFLNGDLKIHDRMAGIDSYGQTVSGIRNLAEIGAELQLNTVITNHNFRALKNVVNSVKECKAVSWWLIFPVMKERSGNVPEVSECYQDIDNALDFAKQENIQVVTGLFHNPYIPEDLNLDYDTAELKHHYSPLQRRPIIDWEITNSCNYGCWYCGLKNEMADSVHVDGHEKVIEQLKKLPGVWEIIVYGGEPLIVDNISEILSSIIENTRHKIIIVTNLSPSVEKLKKILDLPPDRARITASFHSDFCDMDSFVAKAVDMNDFFKAKGIMFQVVSVALKDRLKGLELLAGRLKEKGVEFELQPHRHKGCFVDYSEEEQEFIAAQGRTFGLGDMNFKDRLCYAGVDYFVLSSNGDCYRCYAAKVLGKNLDSYLGNISDGTFKPWNRPRKCIYERCQCITPYDNNLVEREKDVSIVIPSYNRKELLEPALISLFMQDYPKEKYEIVVVDDGSTDNTLDMVKQLKPTCDLKYIYWPRSRPYVFGEAGNRAGPARNLGVMHTTGKNLLFWDSDMVAARDMLSQHMSDYSGDSVVLGLRKNLKQIGNKKLLEKLVSNISFEVLDFGPDTRLGKILAENNYDIIGFKNQWFFVMSNNLLLSKGLFDSVGGFDNNFVFWGDEDQELGYRLWQKGVKFCINTKAVGFHQYHCEESIGVDNFQKTKNIHLGISYKKHLSSNIHSAYMEFRNNTCKDVEVPFFITINPTSSCNLSCPMCSTPKSKQDVELLFDDMKKVVDEICAIGIKRLSFCGGGEPTLHKDFFEILAYAKQKGLVVYLNTNGSFNSDIADRLAKSGIDFVIFSLDFSDPKKHDVFRGMPGLFDCVVSNIERLKNTTKVRIRAVITSKNVGELPELAQFTSELGIRELQLQPVNPYVGVVENGMVVERDGVCLDQKSLWIKPDQYSLLDKVVDELIEFKEKHGLISNSVNYLQLLKRYFRTPKSSDLGFSCPGGNYFGIQYDGRVVPCWGIDWNIGSIREKPLQQILNSKEYFNGKNLMKTCNFPCMQVCYQDLGKSVDAAQNAYFPSTWKIEPTTKCNLQCPACPTGKGLVPLAEMSFSQYKKIIDDNLPHIKTLLLWGYGEPLLHKDLARMIRYAKSNAIGCVKTSTNCHFLTKKKIQQLLHSRLDHLIVCLDGSSEETYLKYRKNGNFKKVLRNIRFLVQEKKKLENPIIELQFIIMSHNEHEIEIVKELAKQLGVDKISLKTAGILPGDEHLLPSQDKYNRYARKSDEKSCNLPSELVFVRADGSVNPCYRLRTDMGEEYVMGNVFSQGFSIIWNNKKYSQFRARISSDRLHQTCCGDCPLPGNGMYYEEKEVMAD